jgi:hypothetical protein
MTHRFISFVLLCACASPALAQLPTTQLTSIFPPGAKQGSTAEVTIAGADMDEVHQLHFTHPGIIAAPQLSGATALTPAKPIPNKFVVTVAADTPKGIYEVRAYGRFGLSNPRSFVVGTLRETLDPGGNTSPEKAIELPLGTTLCGRVDPSTFEFVRLNLKKNQPVLVEVMARRIDSKLDGTLVLLDASGRELTRVKQGAGADPVLLFSAPADGLFTIKLSDAVYGGGDDYFYRLTASDAPFVDYVFPPSGVAGSSAKYTIFGRNLPGGKPAAGLTIHGMPLEKLETTIPLPADEAAQSRLDVSGASPLARAWQDAIEYRLPTESGPANPVSIYFAAVDSLAAEQEPNNQPAQAQKLKIPCEVAGQFYPERDFDWYEFEAQKGQTFWIEAIASQLGLASDPCLLLYRVKGDAQTEITQADDLPDRGRRNPATEQFDATHDDPAYKFVVPEDGTYRLMVRDQFGDGRRDPSYVYRLVLREPQPDFRLLAYALSPPPTQQLQNQTPLAAASLRQGGTVAINVVLQRRDEFDGEVSIQVEGLPTGVSCPGAVLGGTVTEGTLVLLAAEDASAWAGPIKIVATTRVDGKEVTREARYAVVAWGSPNRTQQPAEFRLAPELRLGVIDKESEPALVRIGEDKLYETSLGGNLELPITLTRRGDYKDPIKLVAVGLTQQMRPKDVTLSGDTNQAKFELSLNQQNIRPGSYTFYMKGESKRRYARNPEAIAAAEAEQKRVAAMIESINSEIKSATEAGDQAAAKAAQEKLKEATELKTQCDKRCEDAKKANQPKDVPIALVSTPIKLRIHPSPFNLALQGPSPVLKPGGKQQVTVTIERLFGFSDQVELILKAPTDLTAPKLTLKKDESEAKLEITATEKAAAGAHTCTLQAVARFNNVQVETAVPLTINVASK